MILEINDSCEFVPEINGNKAEDKPLADALTELAALLGGDDY